MLELLGGWVDAARRRRWLHLCVVNLRLLLGFAFLPAGLKKVLNQPFTDPANHGPFHDFLDAFHATGFFYQSVGAWQLLVAVLLLTQRFALLGALIALPIITTIVTFCWSTGVVPTAIVATMMWSGVVGLLLWELPRWRGVVPSGADWSSAPESPVDVRLWSLCGLGILILYLSVTALAGEIYRPRRVELDVPAFYLLVVIALLPVVTYVVERRRRRG